VKKVRSVPSRQTERRYGPQTFQAAVETGETATLETIMDYFV
jgi:hypothetical protein